jgi:hypothetical protein
MTYQTMYFIGEEATIDKSYYIANSNSNSNGNSIFVYLNNIIASYYPLYYENTNNFKSLNNGAADADIKNIQKIISTLNNEERIYNANNTIILSLLVIILWVIILFLFLRFIYIQFPTFYLYTLLTILIIILICASVWSIYSMSQNI